MNRHIIGTFVGVMLMVASAGVLAGTPNSLAIARLPANGTANSAVSNVVLCNANVFVMILASGQVLYAYLPDLTQNEFDNIVNLGELALENNTTKTIGYYFTIGSPGTACGYTNAQEISGFLVQ